MAGRNAGTLTRRLRCSGCHILKEREQFHVRSNRASGRASRCTDCERARSQVRYDAGQKRTVRSPDQVWKQRLWTWYRLTPELYEAMLASQDGVCALCCEPETALNPQGEVRRLAVDHDHACCPGTRSCGQCVRALLCSNCNNGLGCFRDSPRLLERAVLYLGGGSDRGQE